MLEALELLVLAAAPWPLYRALAIPHFRRFYTCFAICTLILLLLYAVAVVSLALYLPSLLPVATMLALAGLAAERWRARSDYGKARKLPPGSLALVPRLPWLDHRFYLKQARRHGPVFKFSLYFKPMACIVGADLGHDLLQSHGDALRAPPVRFNRIIPGGFLRYMEGSTHAHYRRILQNGFAPSVLEQCDDYTRTRVRAALAGMARSGGGIGPRSPLSEMFLVILLHLFFGVSDDSGAFGRLRKLYERIDVRKAACSSVKKEQEIAVEITRLIRQQVELLEKQSPGGETPPSCVLVKILRDDPAALVDETILLNLVYMVQVGRNDMTGLLMWILKKLADHPEFIRQLRDQIGPVGDHEAVVRAELAELIVKETLRLEQSEFLSRKASADIHFKGFTIPRGWLVRICVREGHRDPDRFRDPERFDPHRFEGHGHRTRAYSPLGMLGHSCLGAQIVSHVGRTFVTELARGFDLRVVSDGPREFGVAHWTPSSAFRINLQARSA